MESIGEGVDGGDDEVEAESPVGKDREVAEFACRRGAAAELVMCTVPPDLEKEREDDVERL